MYKNGISHLTAASDLDGALQIVNYLMFIPGKWSETASEGFKTDGMVERRGRAIPILPTGDSWDRNVDYKPPKGPYDPRQFLCGCNEEVDGVSTWKSGILDNGSFFETMGMFLSSVICGAGTDGYRWMGANDCHWSRST